MLDLVAQESRSKSTKLSGSTSVKTWSDACSPSTTAQAALNNNHNLFRMHGLLNEIRSSKINIEAVISHVESQIFAWQRYIREELRTLIAA